MTESLSKKLSLKVRLGYGIGDTAICFYWSGVGFLLLYFYTDVVGISPILAGSIFMIGMLWDAFTDPFMGYMAERTRTKWGVYRPYLLFGNIPLTDFIRTLSGYFSSMVSRFSDFKLPM